MSQHRRSRRCCEEPGLAETAARLAGGGHFSAPGGLSMFMEGNIEMSKLVRFGTVAIARILGVVVAGPALADSGNFGQQVHTCASMMLPYDLNSDGSITMTMPDGTSMYFRTFGAMVTYMRSQPMCS